MRKISKATAIPSQKTPNDLIENGISGQSPKIPGFDYL